MFRRSGCLSKLIIRFQESMTLQEASLTGHIIRRQNSDSRGAPTGLDVNQQESTKRCGFDVPTIRSGVRELELVRLVLVRNIAARGLEVPADPPTRRAVVQDRLQVPTAVDAAFELRARVPAHIDLARPDGDYARAVRADVVVLVARSAQLLQRRRAVVHRRAPARGLADGFGQVRGRAHCWTVDQRRGHRERREKKKAYASCRGPRLGRRHRRGSRPRR